MNAPVANMFSRIAGVYDLLNHVLSLGIDKSWRRRLALLTPQSGVFLDLAAGTLDVSQALHKARPKASILALDFCLPMLKQGLKKLRSPENKAAIMPACGDALALPLQPESVDAITIAFGIRNIKPRQDAFKEMLRVLKPGGRACILEFGSASERIWGGLYNLYLGALLPTIGRLISRDKAAYTYLARTVKEFPPAPVLAAEMEQAGFGPCQFRKLTGGIVCLHWAEKPINAGQDK